MPQKRTTNPNGKIFKMPIEAFTETLKHQMRTRWGCLSFAGAMKRRRMSKKEIKKTNHEQAITLSLFDVKEILICREIESANVLFGIEQKNKYIIRDPNQPDSVLGHICEETENAFLRRQFLGRFRPFSFAVYNQNWEKKAFNHQALFSFSIQCGSL